MNFLVYLPKTRKLHNSIRVFVERIAKSSHFILGKSIYNSEDYPKVCIDERVRWSGIPLSTISYRGAQFTSLGHTGKA